MARLNELEDQVVEQENALAAMAEKIRTRDEDIISLRTRLQEQGLQYAGEKQTYDYFVCIIINIKSKCEILKELDNLGIQSLLNLFGAL